MRLAYRRERLRLRERKRERQCTDDWCVSVGVHGVRRPATHSFDCCACQCASCVLSGLFRVEARLFDSLSARRRTCRVVRAHGYAVYRGTLAVVPMVTNGNSLRLWCRSV